MMHRISSICIALQLLGVALAQDCTCDCKWKPVCGQDSNTYTNACIATCQGIAIARNGVCAGGPPAKPSSIREDCIANMELMNAFQGQGFVFIGRESFKHRTGPPASPQNVADNPGKPSADDLAAFRITSDGFTYASSSKRGGGPSFPGYTKTEPHNPGFVPPHARRNLREVFEGQQVETLDGSLGSDHRDLAVFGTDTRTQISPTTIAYENTITGQLDMTIGTSGFTCSGALVSSTSVLTAGHCVHEGSGGSFFDSVNFAPGRDSSNTFGLWQWKYLTTFGGWKKRGDFKWDMAVVTYNPNENGLPGDYLGWLGTGYPMILSNTCTPPTLTTTGYPGDKPFGTQWQTTCSKMKLKCDGYIGKTACDMRAGQSGSPLYDASTLYAYGVWSYEYVPVANDRMTFVYADSDYPTYYNGFNMFNSYKWPSVVQWMNQI